MGNIAPFPHVEMHVRDKSIYEPVTVQITPLHKPIYMMRTRKGDPGVPVWCQTYMDAVDVFGADTFNPKSKYYSEHAYFLLKTFSLGQGAWLMRCASDVATASKLYVEVAVIPTSVKQWKRNSITGQFVLDDYGNKIAINEQGEELQPLAADKKAAVYDINVDALIGEKLDKQMYAYKAYAGYTYTPVATVKESTVLYHGTGSVTATACSYDEVDLSDLSKAFYIKQTEGETTSFIRALGDKDPSQTYYTIEFASYASETIEVPAGTTIDLINDELYSDKVWFTREADPSKRGTDSEGEYIFRYVKNDTAVGGAYNLNGVQLKSGDVVATNGDVWRTESKNVYAETTDTTYQEGKTYYTASEAGGQTTYTEFEGSAFEDGVTYYEVVGEEVVDEYLGNIGSALYVQVAELDGAKGDMEPQATIEGVKLVWRSVLRKSFDDRTNEENTPTEDSNGIVWYPMFNVIAANPGSWGQSFGFRFFYDRTANTIAGTMANGAISYTIAPMELREGDTSPREVTDNYGQTAVGGVMKPGTSDPQTGTSLVMTDTLPMHYFGSKALPCSFIFNSENWAKVGAEVMKAEILARSIAAGLYPDLREDGTDTEGNPVEHGGPLCIFVDDLLGLVPGGADATTINDLAADATPGYMANIVSAVSCDNVPFFATEIEAALGSDFADVVDLTGSNTFYLKGGEDGPIADWDIEEYTRKYIDAMIAGTHVYLSDYLRCDYNAIFDVGYSLATKKKLLEFMNYRDNLFVFLTAQSTMKYKETRIIKGQKVDVEDLVPAPLTQFEEETIGALLRTYGLLMIDDIENNTGANRCAIFLSSGINADHADLHDLTPFTLWAAMKYAKYLCTPRMTGAPIERPGSEVDCFDKVAWTAFVDETRSRIWNAGLCYPQYADRQQIQVAALRTIYRYDTSVLCDISTALATTFCKDIIRNEWTYWVNSDRDPADLNSRIAEKLDARTKYALNGRYNVSYNVYQTDEDVKLGFSRQVECDLTANPGNRVWKSTITLRKTGYDPDAEG